MEPFCKHWKEPRGSLVGCLKNATSAPPSSNAPRKRAQVAETNAVRQAEAAATANVHWREAEDAAAAQRARADKAEEALRKATRGEARKETEREAEEAGRFF